MKLFLSIFLIIFSFQSLGQSDTTSNRKFGFGLEYQPGFSKYLMQPVLYFLGPSDDQTVEVRNIHNFSNRGALFLNKRIKENIRIEFNIGFTERSHKTQWSYYLSDSLISKTGDESFYLTTNAVIDFHFKRFYIGIGPEVGFFLSRNLIKSNGEVEKKDMPFQDNFSKSRKVIPALILRSGYQIKLTEFMSLRLGLYTGISSGPRYLQYGITVGLEYFKL